MYFYTLLVEPHATNQIKLHGREVFYKDKKKIYGEKKSIIVEIEPEYIHYTKRIDLLKEKVKNIKFEIIEKKNYFYDDLPVDITVLKTNVKNLSSFLKNTPEKEEIGEIKTFIEFSTLVEQFMINKKVKGPCILEIKKINVSLNSLQTYFDSIVLLESNIEFPTLKIGICYVETGFIKVNIYEITGRSYKFLRTVKYNQISDELDILAHHNLRITHKPGIWIINTFECAKFLIKGRSFSLDEIVTDKNCFDKTFETLLLLNVLDLSKELSEITGHAIQRTMTLRAERTEFLLMNWMYSNKWLIYNKNRKYIDKTEELQKIVDNQYHINEQKEQTYTGGLVLTPVTGMYENVILIDFNSLYPSIVIENNLCFSTRKNMINYSENNTEENDYFNEQYEKKDVNLEEMALLPKILHTLIQRRKNLKKQISKLQNTDKNWHVYDARQQALKITANSIYGCLGSHNRFCDIKMASFITAKGRNLLKQAKEEVEKLGYSVIYGDTDSLMVHLKHSDITKEREKIQVVPGDTTSLSVGVKSHDAERDIIKNIISSISQNICKTMNQLYNHIVIELEEIFEKILLLTKKKYTGITYSGNIIMKGIEKRDYCKLSNDFITGIIECILRHSDNENIKSHSDNEEEKSLNDKLIQKLVDLKINLKKYPIDYFVMEKLLAKQPENYKAPQGCAHVMLALKVNEFLVKKRNNPETKENIQSNNHEFREYRGKLSTFKKNDIISFFIGNNNEAFLPSEKMSINYDFYLKHQLLGPFFKIIAVVGGINIDSARKLFNISIDSKFDCKLRIITNCCNNEQTRMYDCLKCNQLIDTIWLKNEVYKQLIERINVLYERVFICGECDHKQEIRLRCFNCNSSNNILDNMEKKNKDFDTFLEEASKVLGNSFDSILRLSEYRTVNLIDYFEKEICQSKST